MGSGLLTFARIGVPVGIAAGLWIFLSQMHRHYPVGEWLFWRYLGYWTLAGVFSLSSLVVGSVAVSKLLNRQLERDQLFALGFAAGALLFGLGIFFSGLLGLFGGVFFFAYPVLLTAPFVPAFVRQHGRWLLDFARSKRAVRRSLLWTLPVGTFFLVLTYFPLITPQNLAYDARWYHLPIAEHYAAAGRITRFDEGWALGAYPQLGSLFYTWAMQLPFGRYFDRALLCVHIEWAMFAATVASLPPLVRSIAPGISGVGAGLSIFLFPGLHLYDSNLGGGGDHFVAAFAPALWLALLSAWRTLEIRSSVLLAVLLGAAALTKYTASLVVLPAAAAFALRAVWLGGKSLVRREGNLRRICVALGAFLLAALLITAPHWLKNIIFYRDPLFPMLHTRILPDPWVADAKIHYDYVVRTALASAPPGLQGIKDTLRTSVNFAFVPHDWPNFHGKLPVIGALFTLSWLVIPFFGRWRIIGLAAGVQVGIAFWYLTHHWDRFLQALIPWMAAVTAAMIALAWRQGWIARTLVGLLCAVQVVWGGDVPFLPTHSMVGDTPFREAIRLLSEGYKGHYDERLVVSHTEKVSAALPHDAKVVIHNEHLHHGLERMSVNDRPQFQTGLSYAQLGSPRAVHDQFIRWGVTHVLVPPQPSDIEVDSVTANLVFWEFFVNHTEPPISIGGHQLARLNLTPPPTPPGPDRLVAYFTCKRAPRYTSGLYRLADMKQMYDLPYPPPLEALDDEDLQQALTRADFAIIDECLRKKPSLPSFHQIYRRFEMTLFQNRQVLR